MLGMLWSQGPDGGAARCGHVDQEAQDLTPLHASLDTKSKWVICLVNETGLMYDDNRWPTVLRWPAPSSSTDNPPVLISLWFGQLSEMQV